MALAASGFPHRAAAAFFATSVLFSGVSLTSRALAPRFPSATAAGFFRFAIMDYAKRSGPKLSSVLHNIPDGLRASAILLRQLRPPAPSVPGGGELKFSLAVQQHGWTQAHCPDKCRALEARINSRIVTQNVVDLLAEQRFRCVDQAVFQQGADLIEPLKRRHAQIVPIEPERAPPRALAACEAVARLRREVGAPLAVLNPEGLPREAGQSQVALVGASKVVLTGSQVSFGFAEKDARLAFERLERSLEQAGASTRGVAFAQYYALASGIADQVRKVRREFFDAARPPAGSIEPVEGLPSMDAGFAMDVVAMKLGRDGGWPIAVE